MHYIIYTHIYIERNESDLKSKLYWPGPPLTKTNTINNCIGICLLKMLRNAVYSFAAPFAVEIVIVMIEHYIHTYIYIQTDLLRTYLCVAQGNKNSYTQLPTKCIYTQNSTQKKNTYYLFVSCYLPLAFVCLRRVINCRLKYYKPL